MPMWSQITLQDSISPVMEELELFHDHAMSVMIFISIIVFAAMMSVMKNLKSSRNLLESQSIETIWTIIPAIMLIILALPSLRLLYLLDETPKPDMSLKVTGHQWFWSYNYDEFPLPINFDSYMINEEDLKWNNHRLLDVSSRCVLPTNTTIRAMITSEDVIHSWAIPSMGIKVDAIPGRVNQTILQSKMSGVYYGQCSEICGANHSFMPISLEFIPIFYFSKWLMI